MITTSEDQSSATDDRDATLRLIDWFSIERVRKANILVVGAGAIGNEVLKNLALLGVGNIFIIDRDTIELSNLTRSILYRETDYARPKAQVAARAVRNVNPHVKARWKRGDLRFDLGLGLIKRMDVVIAGLDNVAARDKIYRLCLTAGRPWVDAGIGVLDGQVCVYSHEYGACYECYYSAEQLQRLQKSCEVIASRYEKEGKVATTPTIASIVAGVQVQEALKLLDVDSWKDRTLISREFYFNGTYGEVMINNLVRNQSCRRHFTVDPNLVIEMKKVSAYTTSVRELLDQVEEVLGAPASVGLNYDLAVEMPCDCSNARLLLRPVEALFKEDLKCENCGWQPERRTALKTRNTLDRNLINKYPEAIGEAKLIDIGIPALDIMRVNAEANPSAQKKRKSGNKFKDGQANVERFIELTGDVRPDFYFDEA